MAIVLLPGFRFAPMDRELIQSYLKPKVLGEKLPCDIINEIQVFGPNANPWQLFDPKGDSWMVSGDDCEKVIYVFTQVTKKASSTEKKKKGDSVTGRGNVCRTAGCGTWSSKASPKPIKDKGRVVGEMRYLVFEINEIGADFDVNKVGGQYSMHEFSLFGVETDIVLCRITLDQSKNPVFKLREPESANAEKDTEKINKSTKTKKNPKQTNQSTEGKKETKKIDERTKARKNRKKTNLVETGSFLSEEGVYGSDIAGKDQNDTVEIVNSTSDNNFSGVEGTDQGLLEQYVGAITADTSDLIVYNERGVYESVVEDGDGSQVMEINCYQENDIEAIWNTLPTPNLDDMMVNATGVAGYFDKTNESPCDLSLYGVGEDGLYMSDVPSTSFVPPVDPHEVDLYFDVEALLNDLNSKAEEPAVFENNRSKLLAKRKLVPEIHHEAKRLCL